MTTFYFIYLRSLHLHGVRATPTAMCSLWCVHAVRRSINKYVPMNDVEFLCMKMPFIYWFHLSVRGFRWTHGVCVWAESDRFTAVFLLLFHFIFLPFFCFLWKWLQFIRCSLRLCDEARTQANIIKNRKGVIFVIKIRFHYAGFFPLLSALKNSDDSALNWFFSILFQSNNDNGKRTNICASIQNLSKHIYGMNNCDSTSCVHAQQSRNNYANTTHICRGCRCMVHTHILTCTFYIGNPNGMFAIQFMPLCFHWSDQTAATLTCFEIMYLFESYCKRALTRSI